MFVSEIVFGSTFLHLGAKKYEKATRQDTIKLSSRKLEVKKQHLKVSKFKDIFFIIR